MNSNLRNKISEQRGASFVMALFGLAAVMAVSEIILGSALTNMGRVRRNRQAEQNYLTESSAAGIMKEALSGVRIHYSTRTVENTGGGGSTDVTGPRFESNFPSGAQYVNPLEAPLTEWFTQNAVNGSYAKIDEDYCIRLSGATDTGELKLYDVLAHAQLAGLIFRSMEEDESSSADGESRTGSVKLIIYFTLTDQDNRGKAAEQNYRMTLVQHFDCYYRKTIKSDISAGESGDETITTTTEDYTFTAKGKPEISRGLVEQ